MRRPTLAEYEDGWTKKLAWHARPVRGRFSDRNLVPRPRPDLWQDVPHAPFDARQSREAQARLSVKRPHCELQEPKVVDAKPKFAHMAGDCVWKRRGPLQLSSTVGFVLNQNDGSHVKHISVGEINALHE